MNKDAWDIDETITLRLRSMWPGSGAVRAAVGQEDCYREVKPCVDKSVKHILFLVSSMQGGGAERVAALLCNHWATRGHHVTLMPTFSGRGECLYPLDPRVQLDYLADRVGTTKQSAWNQLLRLRVLRRIIRDERPDVVVAFLPNVNVAAMLATMGSGIPIVVSERTYPPACYLSVGLDRLRRWLYPQASAVVMQTNRGRDWLASVMPHARGEVIHNPVLYPLPAGTPRIAPDETVAKERKILLAVGRLSKEKRFDLAIEVFAKLAEDHSGWDLVVIGDGPERGKLERFVQQKGLTSRVYLPGRVGNLADWYQRADMYVLNSRFEGFPNTLLEAMAHGLPVVSVDCDTGPSDIIRHDLDGVLVASDDEGRALTQALDALLSNPGRRARLAAAAISVRGRFSMVRIAAEWDHVLGLV